MLKFNYQAREPGGKKIRGILEAANADEVASSLGERGLIPIAIEQEKGIGKDVFNINLFGSRVSNQEILNFSRQMSILINAGVPIIKAIRQLGRSARSKNMQKILIGVGDSIEAGKKLSDSLAKYSDIFSPVFINLVNVGENTGKLDEVFKQLTIFLETRMANKKRLAAAIRYPVIVIVTIVLAMLVVTFFVIPKFAKLFSQFKTGLPLPTKILIGLSNFLLSNWIILFILLIAAVFFVRYLLTIPKFRLNWDHAKLHFPVLGDLQLRILLAQFSWTLGMVLSSGVPALKGITLAAETTNNKYVEKQIILMRNEIDQGVTFSQAAQDSNLFKPGILQMFEVGEQTGEIDTMLTKIATIYEQDIDYDLKNLSDLLAPMLLIIVGAMVVLLALAVYLPLWDMISAVRMG